MKNQAKLFVIASLALGLAALTFAQGAGPQGGVAGPKEGHRQGGGGMGFGKRAQEAEAAALKSVGATPDQIKKVAALHAREQGEVKALMAKYKDKIPQPTAGTRPEMPAEVKDAMKKFRDRHVAAMKKILGAKYPAYEAAMKEARKNMMGKGDHAPGGGAAN